MIQRGNTKKKVSSPSLQNPLPGDTANAAAAVSEREREKYFDQRSGVP